jgi:hypothetical protein
MLEAIALAYAAPFVWLVFGATLGARGQVARAGLLTTGLVVLVLGMALLNPDAHYGDGRFLTATTFAVVFLWLPAVWAGFFVGMTIAWLTTVRSRSNLGK